MDALFLNRFDMEKKCFTLILHLFYTGSSENVLYIALFLSYYLQEREFVTVYIDVVVFYCIVLVVFKSNGKHDEY